MRGTAFFLCMTMGAMMAQAQSAAKPATGAKTAVHHAATTATKLPPGVPPVHAVTKTEFALRYQDIKIGTGELAQPNWIYRVHYTGWLASDGRKFDSSYDHPGEPVTDKDGKLERDANGQVKLSGPEPIAFPEGYGRVIPGFDQGFDGMHVGGKRRLFIPWQLAYGAKGRPGPDAAHPGIPAKADLIFDVELVEQKELQMPAGHPGMMGGGMPGRPGAAMPPGHPPVTPGQPAQPAQ
ncbi:MAG: FKBP-type peptidyl-prolyl cis-trans isomerase, partial [Terracidiphilus sp.]